jgi:hypothetical protein
MRQEVTGRRNTLRADVNLVKRLWPGQISQAQLESLKTLYQEHQFSVRAGDLKLLDGRWYVTHSGLVRLSRRSCCSGIRVQPVLRFCDALSNRWVFKAAVYKSPRSKGFVGYGDADPSNVSPLVRGAEMRVAETRAVNRALRKAYGIGLCSVEELGCLSSLPQPATWKKTVATKSNGDGGGNGQPRLRDRLCLLIRQHQLDPALVKHYANDFCGTQELCEASRDLIESFVNHLAEWAARDRAGLLSKLNSFAPSKEVHP